jgi:hypothetical protein
MYNLPSNTPIQTQVMHMNETVMSTQKQKVPRIIQVLKVIFEVKQFPIQARRTLKYFGSFSSSHVSSK